MVDLENVDAIILAGGKATRLAGANKALLEIGGRTALERVLSAMRELPAGRIVLVTNDQSWVDAPDLTTILDPQPHAGVLPALLAGLEVASAGLCVSGAGDMPFLSARLYRHLLAAAGDADVVIPKVADRLQPMCAVYRREPCMAAIRSTLVRGQYRMVDFLPLVRVRQLSELSLRQVDPDLRAFFNVNTPADLAEARALAES